MIYVDEDGARQRTSFDEVAICRAVSPMWLKADGLGAAIVSRCFCRRSLELPIAHLAAFVSGMVSIPLFALFGEDALEFRLSNSGAKAIVTDAAGWESFFFGKSATPAFRSLRTSISSEMTLTPAPNRSGRSSKRRRRNF